MEIRLRRTADGVTVSCEPLPSPFPLPADPAEIGAARDWILARWRDRWAEAEEARKALAGAGHVPGEPPSDLSSACKFASIFAAVAFGGVLRGSYDHQFAEVGGTVVDLAAGSDDVRALADPWRHDPAFFGSRDHMESMRSCLPRVGMWLEGFAEHVREAGVAADVRPPA